MVKHFFGNMDPMVYGLNTKINPYGKVISSCFESCKTTLHSFFYKQFFYMLHRVEVWFRMITVICIKRSLKKNKHRKWKTCWVHYCYKTHTSLTKGIVYPFSIDTPYMDYLLPFLQENLDTPVLWFFKILNLPVPFAPPFPLSKMFDRVLNTSLVWKS